MEPTGQLSEELLTLLGDAGLPVVVVAMIGTAIALYQFTHGLNEAAFATQDRAMSMFASSSRRVRAYGLFVISHALATTTTIAVADQLFRDEEVVRALGIDPSQFTLQLQAGIAAYFLVIDWWSLRQGDELPAVMAVMVGLAGALLTVAYGVRQAVLEEAWQYVLPWFATAFLWFRSFGWASSSGSALARAIQNG